MDTKQKPEQGTVSRYYNWVGLWKNTNYDFYKWTLQRLRGDGQQESKVTKPKEENKPYLSANASAPKFPNLWPWNYIAWTNEERGNDIWESRELFVVILTRTMARHPELAVLLPKIFTGGSTQAWCMQEADTGSHSTFTWYLCDFNVSFAGAYAFHQRSDSKKPAYSWSRLLTVLCQIRGPISMGP